MKTALPSLGLFVLAWVAFSTPAHTADKAQDVNVVNTAAVFDVDNRARSPFTASGAGQFGEEGHQISITMLTLPSDKRLVIEQVSAQMLSQPTTTDAQRMRIEVDTITGGSSASYAFTGSNGGLETLGNLDVFVASAQMKAYADPGTTVQVVAGRRSTSACPCPVNVSLSGYLVNVP